MRKIHLIVLIFALLFSISACKQKKTDKEYIKKVALNQESIAVGIFKATGYDYPYIDYIAQALNIDGGMVYVTLTEADLLKTKLDNIDVLIFPSMDKDQKMNKLDDEVADILHDFVTKKGKGAISICNGGEILTKSTKYQSLDLVNIEFTDKIYKVNSGIIRVGLTEEGKKVFPELKALESFTVDYHYGPKMNILDTISDIQILAYAEDNKQFPVLINAMCGNGKLVMSNLHPELTPGMRWMIPRMVRWTFNKERTSYNRKVFRPNLFDKELSLDEDLNQKSEQLLSVLDNGKKDEVIDAMDELQGLYPRLAAEKVRSLLLKKNDAIKLRAAKFLVDIEYTLALDDLNEAIKSERRRKVKEQLTAYRNEMRDMLDQN